MYTYTYIYIIYIHTHTHNTYIYTYIYAYIHVHKHIHIHIYKCQPKHTLHTASACPLPTPNMELPAAYLQLKLILKSYENVITNSNIQRNDTMEKSYPRYYWCNVLGYIDLQWKAPFVMPYYNQHEQKRLFSNIMDNWDILQSLSVPVKPGIISDITNSGSWLSTTL